MFSAKKMKAYGLVLALGAALAAVAGCGQQQAGKPGGAMQVKAMKAMQQDTPLSYEYAGQVKGKNEVKVQPRVSGTIVEKYVTGGQAVHAGQPLYKIDSRQYESALLSAQASLAQSEATLNNSQIDLQRFRELQASEAISEQTVTTQESNVQQYGAATDSNRALVKKAQENLDDTIVYAPMDGRLDVNDVAVGTYASAGQTTLVTIGSVNPVFVQFSISENEYLKFMELFKANHMNGQNDKVTITLSNGTAYPIAGKVVQTDRSLGDNTGTLTVKALFDNPDNVLLPGMFARVKVSGEIMPNAILVPQRAVQQLLDKSFVIVVDENNKSESRAVKLGEKVGSFWIIKEGISANDTVVVEGLTKLQAGVDLDVTMVTPEDLSLSINS
ncbi:MAG: efflux RND transporter periplasmic adaptor subunit [Selenomonadaceae bacterium]